MKTFLGQDIEPTTLGILYLCDYTYNPPKITVTKEIQFDVLFNALQAYANIPNPASQLAAGTTRGKLFAELEQIHNNFNNPEWVKTLGEYL